MPNIGMTFRDTAKMIDCVNSYKREGDWTPLQRRELANEVLKRLDVLHPDPKRTTQIVRRIETLGENWSTRQHTLALFRYGWDVLINEHSREALMSNPEAVRIKRKSLHPAPEENPPGHRRRTCQATPIRPPLSSPLSDTDAEPSLDAPQKSRPQSDTEVNSPVSGDITTATTDVDLEPPERYLPVQREVEGIKRYLMIGINDTITRILGESRTLPIKEPLLCGVIQSPFLFEIMGKIYGTTTEKELMDIIAARDSESFLGLGVLLRVILAVTISRWVLERNHSLILKDPTKRNYPPTETDYARMFPAYYEESLRRERYKFVKEKIKSFLRQNLNDFTAGAGAWLESLRGVFAIALDLDGQLLLWRREVRVFWPVFDKAFNSAFMTVRPEQNAQVLKETPYTNVTEQAKDIRHGGKVRAALFPAIVEIDGGNTVPPKERVIVRSEVILQQS